VLVVTPLVLGSLASVAATSQPLPADFVRPSSQPLRLG
jgi:hypothetical protein